jgi:uncharacterized membrane protein YebE (DUF533 family)
MMDAKGLLEQMLGGNEAMGVGRAGTVAKDTFNRAGGMQGFAGGAVAGGLLGLLAGNEKVRKMAGGVLGYGGAAALGALAHRAYQNYTQGRTPQSAPAITPEEISQTPRAQLPHSARAAGGGPFELVLIEAIIAAAKADGHIDPSEHQRLFVEVERAGLDADSKGYVFDLLAKPADMSNLAAAVTNPEQAGEVYLVSRLAIDPDHAAEKAYLDALAARLQLSSELRNHLERQAAVALSAAAGEQLLQPA